MNEFKHHWESIMRRMTDPLSEQTLRRMLLNKIRHSKTLKEDIFHYDRRENDDPEKSITDLWNCINRAIRLKKEAKNATEQENYLKNELSNAAPSPETPTAKKAAKTKKAAKASKGTPEAAPAPPEQSRGRSQSRGPKSDFYKNKSDDDLAKVCYFHNHDGCNRSPCQFLHTNLSEADKKRQIRPSARSVSPATGKGSGKTKGRGKGKGKSRKGSRDASPAAGDRSPSPGSVPDQRYCHKFLAGSCTCNPCKCQHLTQAQVDKIKKLQDMAVAPWISSTLSEDVSMKVVLPTTHADT